MAGNGMISIDKSKVRIAFDRAAASYDAKADFQHRVCEHLLKLLPDDGSPGQILDGGCGTGYGAELLRRRWPSAQLTGCDLAPEMVRKTQQRGIAAVCGDLEHLPFADARFDLAWSSLALQWCDPALAYAELYRVLAPSGKLACTTLGIGSLHELDAAFTGIDNHRRVLDFSTEQSVIKALKNAGFENIQVVQETWVTRHPDFRGMLETIRGIGANQSGRDKRRSMMGKDAWQAAQTRYESMRDDQGLLPVTYKLMFVFADK
jgi:malonyl-CoA O-methyltransferase